MQRKRRNDMALWNKDRNKRTHKHLAVLPACKVRQKTGGATRSNWANDPLLSPSLPSPVPPLLSETRMFRPEWIRQPSSAESHSRRAGRLPVTGATRGSSSPSSVGTMFSELRQRAAGGPGGGTSHFRSGVDRRIAAA